MKEFRSPGKTGQGGGDKKREFRPLFGQGDFGRKKAFTESDRFDREQEGFFNREQRDGRPRDVSFMGDDRRSSRERGEEYDREGKSRDSNLKGEDRRSSRDLEDDRRDDRHRSSRDNGHEGDDRRGRSSREDRDFSGDRHFRGNTEPTPLRVSIEIENAN